jgi:hypothetical protein
MKYEIRYDASNVYVSRNFPELHQTLTRVIARVEGWERDIEWAKKDILKEARLLGYKG